MPCAGPPKPSWWGAGPCRWTIPCSRTGGTPRRSTARPCGWSWTATDASPPTAGRGSRWRGSRSCGLWWRTCPSGMWRTFACPQFCRLQPARSPARIGRPERWPGAVRGGRAARQGAAAAGPGGRIPPLHLRHPRRGPARDWTSPPWAGSGPRWTSRADAGKCWPVSRRVFDWPGKASPIERPLWFFRLQPDHVTVHGELPITLVVQSPGPAPAAVDPGLDYLQHEHVVAPTMRVSITRHSRLA